MSSQDAYDDNELLWEMGRRVPADGSVTLPEHELVAYREGRLSREDSDSCERHLGRSPEARARLAELAGSAALTPTPQIRDRVLTSFDASFRHAALAPAHDAVRGSLLKAAAIAAIGLGMLFLMHLALAPSVPEPLPADLAYDVEAEGLATVRRSVPGGREVEAYPETRIRITASPRSTAVKDVEFGIYRESAGRLERLDLGPAVEIETIRGAAVLTGRGRDLAFPNRESTRLFLVAARPGDLPAMVELAEGELAALAALEQAGRRRAYSVVIHLRQRPAVP